MQKELNEALETLRSLQFRFDDIVEMHQKEMSALKQVGHGSLRMMDMIDFNPLEIVFQEFSLLEEKISYYIAMKLQDFDDKIQDSNALVCILLNNSGFCASKVLLRSAVVDN